MVGFRAVSMRGAMRAAGFDMQRNAVPGHICSALRHTVLREAAVRNRARTWGGWLGWVSRAAEAVIGQRADLAGTEAGDIREPEHRAHVRIPMCSNAVSALCAALGPGGALASSVSEAGLSPAARLVELSVMIAMPGAVEQRVHTDVPPHIAHPMATLWIALQDVDLSLGPTMVHATNAEQLATRERWSWSLHKAPRRPTMLTYAPDGFIESATSTSLTGETPPSVAMLLDGDCPQAMLMNRGDAMLLDTRIFHFGGANTSRETRAQLRATFEEPLATKVELGSWQSNTGGCVVGFTYELLEELEGAYTLKDFQAGGKLDAASKEQADFACTFESD
eukprot:gnl/MRDRNA2_/MRDRNA2_25137_c0_seq1.p1 gnl/MRDRNA2_/MRDRNA2_25137_c0~~gnl/MRDRNA2_/MRDRNA2_25137_c0_seq1.p1  ORF type:complete len:336 (+),score=34.89 gnl/MRDRNA2_/MRDRNA2_25137_c0_seq1:127-1134(+)